MKLSKHHLAVIALILTTAIWGASAPIFKWSLQEVGPFTFIFIRFLLASLILLPFTLHKLKIARQDLPKVLLLVFVGFTLHIPTIFLGLTMAPSINASIISTAAPVFLLAASVFVLGERVKRKVVFGTVLSLAGILLIVLRPLFDNGMEGAILGNLLFVTSTLCFVLYTILLKEFKLPYSPFTLTFWIFALAAVSFIPLYLWEAHNTPLVLSSQGMIGILFGAVFTSNIAYMLFTFALRSIRTSEVGVFLYVDPLVTVLVAVPLLGEKVTLTFLTGSLLVIAGIFLAEGRIHYHPLHKLRG